MAKATPAKPNIKSTKLSGTEAVTAFIQETEHPLKKAMEVLRALILKADKNITEHIKWKAPSFCFGGDDRITFNIHKTDSILLIFHCGAKVKETAGKEPILQDSTGLLEWLSGDRAVIKLYSLDEVNEKKDKLSKVIKQWIKETAG